MIAYKGLLFLTIHEKILKKDKKIEDYVVYSTSDFKPTREADTAITQRTAEIIHEIFELAISNG